MDSKDHKILSYLQGDLSQEESTALEAWMNESLENKTLFDDTEKLYKATAPDDLENFQPDVDAAWQKVSLRMNDRNERSSFAVYLKVAAMLVMILSAGWVSYEYMLSLNDQSYATKVGEIKAIELSDGTTVWLNELSKISYPKTFAESTRIVKLEGQAYFNVTKNPDRPFIIEGAAVDVKVLGTSFDLNIGEQTAEVNVTSGKVAFVSKQNELDELILVKNQRGVLDNRTMTQHDDLDRRAMTWRLVDFKFKSAPLHEIVKELNDHFGSKIIIEKNIESCKITSTFKGKSLEEILKVICIVAKIEQEKSGDNILLSGKGCQ